MNEEVWYPSIFLLPPFWTRLVKERSGTNSVSGIFRINNVHFPNRRAVSEFTITGRVRIIHGVRTRKNFQLILHVDFVHVMYRYLMLLLAKIPC